MPKPLDYKFNAAAMIAAAIIGRRDFNRLKNVLPLEEQYDSVAKEAWAIALALEKEADLQP